MIMSPVKASLIALHNNTPWWVKLLAPALLTGLLTWGASIGTHDRDIVQRVSALEQAKSDSTRRSDQVDHRLDRMEDKLDDLVEAVIGRRPSKDR